MSNKSIKLAIQCLLKPQEFPANPYCFDLLLNAWEDWLHLQCRMTNWRLKKPYVSSHYRDRREENLRPRKRQKRDASFCERSRVTDNSDFYSKSNRVGLQKRKYRGNIIIVHCKIPRWFELQGVLQCKEWRGDVWFDSSVWTQGYGGSEAAVTKRLVHRMGRDVAPSSSVDQCASGSGFVSGWGGSAGTAGSGSSRQGNGDFMWVFHQAVVMCKLNTIGHILDMAFTDATTCMLHHN
ncbi:hypothetical protein JB92DRAFT_2826753 [Gautieria morchelliformis]|nr:hypothetical protein JB92DRAFT_2826753 [Gautieria morchelliformis]